MRIVDALGVPQNGAWWSIGAGAWMCLFYLDKSTAVTIASTAGDRVFVSFYDKPFFGEAVLSRGVYWAVVESVTSPANTVYLFGTTFIDAYLIGQTQLSTIDVDLLPIELVQAQLSKCFQSISNRESRECATFIPKWLRFVSSPRTQLSTTKATAVVSRGYGPWSDWDGCKETCGHDTSVRTRESYPPLHTMSDNSEVIEETKECNNACWTKQTIGDEWRRQTGCTNPTNPPSWDVKTFTYIDDNGVEQHVDSPYFIDDLTMLRTDELAVPFAFWQNIKKEDVVANMECYGGQLTVGTSITIDNALWNPTGLSVLRMLTTGELVFNLVKPDFTEETKWKANVKVVGTSIALRAEGLCVMNGATVAQVVYKGITSLSVLDTGVVMYTGDAISYCMIFNDVDIKSTKVFTPVRFNDSVMTILSGDGFFVYNFTTSKFDIVDNEGAVTWSSPLCSTMRITSTGLVFVNRSTEVLRINATNLDHVRINSSGRLEFYNSAGYMSRYIGVAMSSLSASCLIARAVSSDESVFIRSPSNKCRLIFQSDGNLVLYNDVGALWATGTTNKPSTHFGFKGGALTVFNGADVVWSSGDSAVNSPLCMLSDVGYLIVVDIRADTTLSIIRCYPDIAPAAWELYLHDLWAKTPAFTLCSTNTAAPLSDTIMDFGKLLMTFNPNRCGPTALLCEAPMSKDMGSWYANILLTTKHKDKWMSVGQFVNAKTGVATPPSLSLPWIYFPSSYKGYEPVYPKCGSMSQPFVNLSALTSAGTVNTWNGLLLQKKMGESEFVSALLNVDSYKSTFSFSAMAPYILRVLYLSDIPSFKVDPAFGGAKSTLDDLAVKMLDKRTRDLQEACYGRVLDADCQALLPNDRFYQQSMEEELAKRTQALRDSCVGRVTDSDCKVLPRDDWYMQQLRNSCAGHVTDADCQELPRDDWYRQQMNNSCVGRIADADCQALPHDEWYRQQMNGMCETPSLSPLCQSYYKEFDSAATATSAQCIAGVDPNAACATLCANTWMKCANTKEYVWIFLLVVALLVLRILWRAIHRWRVSKHASSPQNADDRQHGDDHKKQNE